LVDNIRKLTFILANPLIIESTHVKGSRSLVTIVNAGVNRHYLKYFIFIWSYLSLEFNIFTQSNEAILFILFEDGLDND